ncbi:Nuclear cap-binding protein subunit 1 [Irineochytrium annulatum]|nr:Nuclear cap-binding protein subunit 1 [Irineochytrium annulatum]
MHIQELPMKYSVYAGLTALLNAKNHELVQEVVDTAMSSMDDALFRGDFRSLKLLLRYFGELANSNVILASSFLEILENLFTMLSAPNLASGIVDSMLYVILGALPTVAAKLAKLHEAEFAAILTKIDNYLATRRTTHVAQALIFDCLKLYRDCPTDAPYKDIDRLESLWQQMVAFQQSGYTSLLNLRLHDIIESELVDCQPHNLRPLAVPSSLDGFKAVELFPISWIFDDVSIMNGEIRLASLPPTSSIDRFIMDDVVIDTIYLTSHNHTECVQLLLALPEYYAETSYSFIDATAENLFRELLRLPVSHEKSVYYATLFIDLCKAVPEKVPSAMGRSLRLLYSRMDLAGGGGLDVECIRRLGDWFAHHLSNFGFGWNWKAWEPVLEEPASSRFIFVRETLERMCRLSYYDRIKETLSEPYHANRAIFPPVQPSYTYSYDDTADEELQNMALRVQRALHAKYDMAALESLLMDCYTFRQNRANGAVMSDDVVDVPLGGQWSEDRVVRDLFLQGLLFVGSKSFSHLLNVVERNLKTLQAVNVRPEDKLHTVTIVAAFWKQNPQFLEIILDKLMNYRVIDPTSIVSWALSSAHIDEGATRWYTWTILRNTMTKVNKKVLQIRQKLNQANGHMNVDGEVNQSTVQEALDGAIRDQKQSFILVFQKSAELLNTLLAAGPDADPTKTTQWRWISGLFRDIGRLFRKEIMTCHVTLEATVFVDGIDPKILEIWNEIKAVAECI